MTLPARKSFSQSEPWLQLAWDASSLQAFLKCPRRYFYSIVCGFRPQGESVDLRFGTLVHKALETYHKTKPSESHGPAQIAGLMTILQESWERDGERHWRSPSPNKNLWNALRAFIWHTETFGFEPDFHTAVFEEEVPTSAGVQRVSLPMIEFPFQFGLAFEVAGEEILYCGHLDRVVETSAGRWIVDYKTTKHTIGAHYFDGYQPSTQLPGYAVASKVIFHHPIQGVVIDALQIGVDFVRCGRGHILIGEEKADEWLENARGWIGSATAYGQRPHQTTDSLVSFAATNARLWPMNTESCFICPFKVVCSSTPSVRGHLLESAYINSFWDPLDRQKGLSL